MSVGMEEIIIFLGFVFFLSLPFLLRVKFPDKIWLAVILGFFLPTGQFYIRYNAIYYFIGLLAFAVVGSELTGFRIIDLSAFPGAIINYVRLKKTQDKSVKEKLQKAVNEAQNVNGDTA